jgi:dTDP-glucose 4,6-dehydratase
MRALVTGGAGFIGSNLVKYLLGLENSKISSIKVLDKLTYSGTLTNLKDLPKDSIEFIQGDIIDSTVAHEATSKIDVVFHLAAESHVDRSIDSSRVFIETNALGTQSLLEAALKNDVGTFIHVSTDEVYGSINQGSWTEDFPLSPNSPYSASKAASDLIALAYTRTYGMDIRVTRCSNNYGPNQFPEKVIPLFVTNLIDGKKVPLYGNGKNVRDWLHVSDHCAGIYLAFLSGKRGEIYNIGGGRELDNLELTKIILKEFNVGEERIDYVQDRKGHDLRYSLDISKAQKELGYSPQIDFEAGLKSTINWYRANPNWWRPLKDNLPF